MPQAQHASEENGHRGRVGGGNGLIEKIMRRAPHEPTEGAFGIVL
jgi:hypothetical protein